MAQLGRTAMDIAREYERVDLEELLAVGRAIQYHNDFMEG